MEKKLIDPNRSLKQLERDIKNLKVEPHEEYERRKNTLWNNILKSKLPKGVTLSKLEKLKSKIWDDDMFWFWIERKPEEAGSIVRERIQRSE